MSRNKTYGNGTTPIYQVTGKVDRYGIKSLVFNNQTTPIPSVELNWQDKENQEYNDGGMFSDYGTKDRAIDTFDIQSESGFSRVELITLRNSKNQTKVFVEYGRYYPKGDRGYLFDKTSESLPKRTKILQLRFYNGVGDPVGETPMYWKHEKYLEFDVFDEWEAEPGTILTNVEWSYYGGYLSAIDFIGAEPDVDPFIIKKCCMGDYDERCDGLSGDFTKGSAACSNKMSMFCTASEMHDPYCKKWCMGSGECDWAVREYCEHPLNIDTDFCSCVKHDIDMVLGESGTPLLPRCIDSQCLKNGYETANMKNSKCPDMITCSMKLDLSNVGIKPNTDIKVEQNCGDINDTKTKEDAVKDKTNTETPVYDPTLVFIIIVVFVILLALGSIISILVFTNTI